MCKIEVKRESKEKRARSGRLESWLLAARSGVFDQIFLAKLYRFY
jgi:hypothetical protein